jgi:hypothetical protein
MIPMRQLRSNPHFARLFAHVHPLFWPILWWSLNRLFKWYDTSGYEEILFGTTRWGYVYVAFVGDKRTDPSAYRPHQPRMTRWDDPVWESHVPKAFALIPISLRMDAASAFAGLGLIDSGWPVGTRTIALIPNTS